MKRVISIVLSMFIVVSLPIFSSASDNIGNVVNIGSVTVEFGENSSFTCEEQHVLAQLIANNEINNDVSTTYNLLCTVFGHKTTTETITVIEHCVSDTPPRCIKSFQDVTACSRCDYVDIVELSSIYIYCCD